MGVHGHNLSQSAASSLLFRAVADGIEECEDVFGGCFGLDVVDGIEDETAVFVEDFDSSADFIVDVGG